MNYVGIDWAYGRAAFCSMNEAGSIEAEGMIPASEDGLARLVSEGGHRGEGLRGDDERRGLGSATSWRWPAGKSRSPMRARCSDVAPLACKTDKVDARVLAELIRRDLVPELWVPPPADRALRERLRRRMHLVKTRTAARNRIFGLLTQFGLKISLRRLLAPDAMELLERRGVPGPWRASIAELLEVIAEMDGRAKLIEAELRPVAAEDPRAELLMTMPGIGPLLGLTIAAEIGEVARFSSPAKLVGYAGLAPRISQSGERSAIGSLSKAGSRTLRWAAVEAANQAWRPTNPWHGHYRRISQRHGKNPAKSAVARKILIAAWHMLARNEPFRSQQPVPANSNRFLAA